MMEIIKNTLAGKYKFEDGQTLHFQNGVIPENGVNGVQVEDVLNVLIDRMEYLITLKADKFNYATLEDLKIARDNQRARTADREKRGVEGTEQD